MLTLLVSDLATKFTDRKCFVVLAILGVEKHWAKVRTSAIALFISPSISETDHAPFY